MSTGDLLRTTWSAQPLLVVAIAAGLVLHVALFGVRSVRRTAAMLAALAGVVLALASPVDYLARGYLFSAHMLQHMLLVLAVPPLVLLSIPRAASPSHPRARRLPPIVGWALGVAAMWIWHAPALCNAAATHGEIHALQTGSLLGMGAAFWWPILGPRASDRLDEPAGVAYLFSACVACTVLGVVLTFSPVEVCSAYAQPVDPAGVLPLLRGNWGLTPAVDQQLGGLLMWVPGCAVYAAAILILLARWYAAAPAKVQPAS